MSPDEEQSIKLKLSILSAFVLLGGTTEEAKARSEQHSQASWYGPGLYGDNLACGGILTSQTWGVAHKYLPCGTKLRICYRRCVTATVIDRGPYVYGRDLDLTYPVKLAIGMGDVGYVNWWVDS
jgi:rare lipoprotein A (peptidoglycan hydrolase)